MYYILDSSIVDKHHVKTVKNLYDTFNSPPGIKRTLGRRALIFADSYLLDKWDGKRKGERKKKIKRQKQRQRQRQKPEWLSWFLKRVVSSCRRSSCGVQRAPESIELLFLRSRSQTPIIMHFPPSRS